MLPDFRFRPLLLAGLGLVLSGCTVGPDFVRPAAPAADRFKEAEGWKPAAPQEAASGQDWWSIFNDPTLDGLERQVAISNQTLKADEAAYRQAVALVDEARAGFFPTLSAGASVTRSKSGSGSLVQSGQTSTGGTTATQSFGLSSGIRNEFQASGTASWVPDIWGKIRRTVESDNATARATEDDLAAALLSDQATLATDYFSLRQLDEQAQLLDDTVKAFQRSADITRNQYRAGIVAKTDVITAETQLQGAQSQRASLAVNRTSYEHAIAVLVGQPPAAITIAPDRLAARVPVVPAGLPSGLLERRPDIAAAERRVASANASVGVAIAAWYPDITLSATGDLASTMIDKLARVSNGAWSIGADLTETIFDGGLRSAEVAAARAAYDGTVATYRATVLGDFQQVEDALSALHALQDQAAIETQTVASANEAARLTLNEYKAGTTSYTAVVTAQATALSSAQTLLGIRASQLTNSVNLVTSLGGGWSNSDQAVAAVTGAAQAAVVP